MKIALLLLLTGCAQYNENIAAPLAFHTVDPQLQPYYTEFEQTYVIKIKGIPSGFQDLPQGTVGECVKWSDGEKEIVINSNYWSTLNDDSKKELLFHELGHCVFNRLHNWDFIGGCPKSIMDAYSFGDPCFTENYESYIQELPYLEVGDHL